MKTPALAVGALILTLAPQGARGQEPSIGIVLERAARYVAQFKAQLSGIVAEEIYVQDIDPGFSRRPDVTHRELKSDLLLVRPSDADRYVEFRDVFEVDGRPVRDRQERLTNLFLKQGGSGGQLQKIITESARYNIGNVRRTINTPTLALLLLDPALQSRFTFKRAADRTPSLSVRAGKPADSGSPSFTVSTDVWVVEYEELTPKTFIRSAEGHDMPAHGRFWLDPSNGRLLMTELIAGDGTLRAIINVSYQSEPLLGFLVPVEMRERYEARNQIITGTASYRNFRRFQVQVDERVAPSAK